MPIYQHGGISIKEKSVLIGIIVSLLIITSVCASVNTALAYTGSTEFPELFKYNDQKNVNLETALLSISHSFKDNSVPVTQELLAAIVATLDKEVGENYLPVEEEGDYGMGPSCTYKINGSCRATPYDGGADYKGRGYIKIMGKSNYQRYCGSDCVGNSAPETDVCGCKNQWQCTATNPAICPQAKALQPDYAAEIFVSYYVKNNLVSQSNAKSYWNVGKAINGGDTYASDFDFKANAYLTLLSDNLDKTTKLLTWLNSGAIVSSKANDGSVKGNNFPTVQAFQVTPLSIYLGEAIKIDYTVSERGGSGLKRVELWRKDEQNDWQEIERDTLSGGNGPLSGSFTDSPSARGKYWYGLHVVDNAGNWNDERNSNTNNPPASFEPIEVGIKNKQSS